MLLNNKHIMSFCMLFSSLSYGMFNEKSIQIKQENLFVPQGLDKINLYHDDSGFSIAHDYGITKVKPYNVDKELRGVSQKDLAKLITAQSYISVKELNDGQDYSLKLNHRINGAGPGGATAGFWFGKVLTYGIWQGTIHLIGICTGPAYPVTVATLTASTLPIVEATSNAVALGCGVIGGVATGPV